MHGILLFSMFFYVFHVAEILCDNRILVSVQQISETQHISVNKQSDSKYSERKNDFFFFFILPEAIFRFSHKHSVWRHHVKWLHDSLSEWDHMTDLRQSKLWISQTSFVYGHGGVCLTWLKWTTVLVKHHRVKRLQKGVLRFPFRRRNYSGKINQFSTDSQSLAPFSMDNGSKIIAALWRLRDTTLKCVWTSEDWMESLCTQTSKSYDIITYGQKVSPCHFVLIEH